MPFESLNEALIDCVRACGGSKVVGVLLWPARGVEAAQRHLLDCLNPERPQKLAPEELLHLMRLSRSRGCHSGMEHVCQELSYAHPVPIEPKDEAAELQRQFIEQSKQLCKMAERIERLHREAAAPAGVAALRPVA